MKCEFVPNYFYVPWTYINQNPQPKKLGQKVNDYPKICRIPSQLGTCVRYLYVSGPQDFRLVIQVLFGPRMILNACTRRPDLGLTSHPNDTGLPHE